MALLVNMLLAIMQSPLVKRPRDPAPFVPDRDWLQENWHWPRGDKPLMDLRWGMAALTVMVLALLGMWLWRWWTQRHLRSEPLIVFHQAANHFRIDLQSQWLLIRIARQQALPTPLTLLLSGATLAHHGQAYLQSLTPGKRDRAAARLSQLRESLFAASDG